ncbi:MAG: hypothetical protein ABW092_09260 [Candidatus Thiodiazotropha sp.]
MSALFWFGYYRNDEGHLAAFIFGLFMLMPVLGTAISEAINGAFYSDYEGYFLSYIGLSHVSYGMLKWRDVIEILGQDAG